MEAIITVSHTTGELVLINLAAIKFVEPFGVRTRVSFIGGGDKTILELSFEKFVLAAGISEMKVE